MLKPFLSKLNQLPLWRQQVRVWDSVYTTPTLDRLVSLHAHRLGWMGSSEKRFLRSVLHHDSIVADVGANQGLYTLWLARVAAGGHVYAFEPDPELFECLEQNVRKNELTNISAIQAAASDRSGTLALTANKLNRGDNRVTKNPSSLEQVKAVTLDEILADSRLDLLKIDVQGFEIEVLLGAHETLRKDPGLTIAFEFWPYGLRQAGHQPIELLDLLREAGFQIAALGRDGTLGHVPKAAPGWKKEMQYCNLIASRNKNQIGNIGAKGT
jgi:FkbM family methyltransferase